MQLPHCVPATWPANISPARFASRIRVNSPEGCKIALIGLPDDLGVRLNSGRPGAASGPTAFRRALASYGVCDPVDVAWPAIYDAGDIQPADGMTEQSLHETHNRVTSATRAALELGLFPIGIGGGHDLTFPFARAVIEYWQSKGTTVSHGIYFDAHLDVRDTIGSGMPFRRLIESCGVRSLSVHGLNMFANSAVHVDWFRAHGGRIEPSHAAAAAWTAPSDTFASVDLDVLDASAAPGVSALNPAGWTPGRLAEWVTRLGTDPSVRCIDFMELNPAHDVDGRTARVAAHLFLSFLAAYTTRRLA